MLSAMTDSSRPRWIRFGKWSGAVAVAVALVVGAANVDGFLSFVERFTGSADTIEGRTTTTTAAPPPLTTLISQPPVPTSVAQPPGGPAR